MDDRFLERMDTQLAGFADPLTQLQEALAHDEFELYCQPIRALFGEERYPMAEVLVRMRAEERALLPPGEFLPLLEHYGLMPELDRWVVSRAVERLAGGSRIPRFTINVSGQTLRDTQFVIHVGTQARKAGVAPKSLLFEIDEADVLARPEIAVRFANGMKAVGCGVLVDGFGRRAVSFAPLKSLRIDFLKMDGGIARKLLTSEPARIKTSAMVCVAGALGIGLVAECVEEEGVLARLKAMNVSHVQGFRRLPAASARRDRRARVRLARLALRGPQRLPRPRCAPHNSRNLSLRGFCPRLIEKQFRLCDAYARRALT